MNPSIIHQIFKNNFPLPYYFSDHALSRISQRIIPRDTILLKFLLLSFKRLHINALDNVQKSFALIDDKYYFSLLFDKNKDGTVTLITIIRGKPSSSFTNCDKFICNIDKEKILQENDLLNEYRRNKASNF